MANQFTSQSRYKGELRLGADPAEHDLHEPGDDGHIEAIPQHPVALQKRRLLREAERPSRKSQQPRNFGGGKVSQPQLFQNDDTLILVAFLPSSRVNSIQIAGLLYQRACNGLIICYIMENSSGIKSILPVPSTYRPYDFVKQHDLRPSALTMSATSACFLRTSDPTR